jgi:16S rRNA C1402 (ribose-2'-O) methylase RsmI
MTRGELVVVVEGQSRAPAAQDEMDRVLRVLLASLPASQAAGLAAGLTGAPRNACYRRALELSRQDP